MAEFQRVLKRGPQMPEAQFDIALANLQAGNVRHAKQELAETLKASPEHTPAGLNLAEIQLRSGAPYAAIDLLKPVVEREPRNTQALKLLGIAYMAARGPDKATEIFRSM